MPIPPQPILYQETNDGVDWSSLKERLRSDNFDNGRSPEQLRKSFENSFAVVFAYSGTEIVGTARALSDGICNAYVVDVWTYTPFRRMRIAGTMMSILEKRLPGQHVALFTEDAAGFYVVHGYAEERVGLSKVIGKWLENDA